MSDLGPRKSRTQFECRTRYVELSGPVKLYLGNLWEQVSSLSVKFYKILLNFIKFERVSVYVAEPCGFDGKNCPKV